MSKDLSFEVIAIIKGSFCENQPCYKMGFALHDGFILCEAHWKEKRIGSLEKDLSDKTRNPDFAA